MKHLFGALVGTAAILALTISPVLANSVTVQTETNLAIREALKKALIENNALRSELIAARSEIERLRSAQSQTQAQTSPAAKSSGPTILGQPASLFRSVESVKNTHTVSKGETLGSIAAKYLGSAGQYRKIFDANRNVLSSPNSISPGQVLTLP
ncbi:MAG: LysM peptidoglycan-binding domain-containing protein [Candidatus Lindowbacteria bacterium]|nr:LysM peptidoglycan-binding domain-containing protein [Candidatus Lindowbacteria bacterium]